ncbi:lantibiotic dehydratase family protein [Streptomyces sp. NBC_00433]
MAGTTGGVAEGSARAPGAVAPAVTVSPYALVRTVALAAAEPSPDSLAHRECAGRLVELALLCEQVRAALCDSLHERARTAAADVRGRVLLPLRRDVHNGRSPRSALRAALADLDLGTPLLDTWLTARDGIDRTAARLALLGPSALRADREALAALCRSEDLQRAVALTSEDLLRAVRRAAARGGEPDKQGRKSEATVLRYAMRAVTRTSPLSWFCHVGWGRWEDGAADAAAHRPFAVAGVQRSLLDALLQAVLGRQELASAVDYQPAPDLYAEGVELSYRRVSRADGAPPGPAPEEKVTLRSTPALRLVVDRCRAGGAVRQHDLADAVARRLGGPPERAERAAAAYVASLVDQGLLRPVPPFDPQARDIVPEACRWLAGLGLPELAGTLAAIGAGTAGYPHLPAASRPAALARIRSHWSEAFALAGSEPGSLRAPLTEDVVLPSVTALGPGHGKACLPDIARLGPLFEVFDGHAVLRRMTRDRFVARFGVGGTCDSLAGFAEEIVAVREVCDGLPPGGTPPGAGGQVRDLLGLRAELARLVPAAGPGAEAVLPEELLDEAARRTPSWVRRRPASYGVFVQPVPDGPATRLCVNHVYGGWGRFTSRFLDHLDPGAGRQVSARIADALGEGERVAQVRPVGGFNANLHPRLVADEVSEAAAAATLRPEELQLFHDAEADQLRLRVTATGEPISVLYLGFLLPSVLPDRWMPLVDDLGAGPVDLGGALAQNRPYATALGPIGYRPRLRYRDVVVARAQWRLPKEAVHAWRAELDRDPPVQAVARRRALLGLPEHVFVAAAPPRGAAGTGALMTGLAQPKSQYVDLGSALHLRCLSRTLARYPDGVVVGEALPVPMPGVRAVELVIETYRSHP